MPIIFVHGVAVRDDSSWAQIETYLRRYVAPAIAPDSEKVAILPAFWGDAAAHFFWGGASRPHSPLLGQGSGAEPTPIDRAVTAAALRPALRNLPPGAAPTPAGVLVAGGVPAAGPALRLKDLTADQLSELLVTVALQMPVDPQQAALTEEQRQKQRALLAIAADDVARAPGTPAELAQCRSSQEELVKVQSLIASRYAQVHREVEGSGLVGQGAPAWLQGFQDGLGEAIGRTGDLGGFVATRVIAEVRRPINDMITLFLGDVFTYLRTRLTDSGAPGPIPLRVLEKLAAARDNQLQRGGEPLIVVTHSMGGQIMYDIVSYFLPKMPQYAGIRVDFWCATASQVGLFEEMKLFLVSDDAYKSGNPVPFPDHRYLGGWWNVWDHNDFISFTSHGIVAGVDDEPYDSGMSGVTAHGGYLARPSFYRAFANKLVAAKAQNWSRP